MMTNKRVIKVLILLSFMYLSLIGYLTYIEFFQRETLVNHSANQRNFDIEDIKKRGNITDINGIILAEYYPYK